MSFALGSVLRDAVDRLTTATGIAVILGIAVFSVIRTSASQDVWRGTLERLLTAIEGINRGGLGPRQREALEVTEGILDAGLADLPLALGLHPILAVVLWVIGYVLGLVIIVLAIDAFAHERDAIAEISTDRLGWKTLNLLLATIVFSILFVGGMFLFVIPALIFAVVLLFFPAAIVLDDAGVFASFASSAAVVRQNLPGTIGIIIVAIVVSIVLAIVGTIISGFLPAVAGVILEDLVLAAGTTFILAMVARGYIEARGETESPEAS